MRLIVAAFLALIAGASTAHALIGAKRPFLSTSQSGPLPPNQTASAILKQWLKADAGCLNGSSTACANGDTVATWNDSGPRGNNAVKCAAGPAFTTNAWGTKPGLAFTAASSQCMTSTMTGTPGTLMVVYATTTSNPQVNSSTYNAVVSGAPQTGGPTITAYDIYADSADLVSPFHQFHTMLFNVGTTNNATGYSWTVMPARHRNVLQIRGFTQDGTTLTAYDAGVQVATTTIPNGATVYSAASEVIGSGDFGGAHGSYMQGTIFEVIQWSGKLSTSDYQRVVAYEQQKYGAVPSGSYVMMSGNTSNGGGYKDNNLYLLQGDGTNFPYALPSNYVPSVLSGQPDAISLAPQLLHDQSGNLVKYNGRYWAEDSRCPYNNGIVWPCHLVDILTSTDFVNWSLAGTIDCDQVLDGVSSTRGCFNDGFAIDAADNSVHALFNASNTESTLAAIQEYQTPITLNANGTFSASTPQKVTGTALPAGSSGTANSGFYAESFTKIGSTYYMFLNNGISGSFVAHMQWTTSSAPFSGYNGTLNNVLVGGVQPTFAEWPYWDQTGGNGQLHYDTGNVAPYGNATASDSALGTSGGLTAGASMTFPGAFFPQAASVAKLPAVSLP